MPGNSRLFIFYLIFIDIMFAAMPLQEALMFRKMLQKLISF